MMSSFTTYLSLNLLVKEFLKLVNIGEVTGKMVTAAKTAHNINV